MILAMKTPAAALALFLGAAGLAAQTGADTPSRAELDKWLAYVLPKPDELAWRKIPWRYELGTALVQAKQQDKPVLLWAMNGHPLGCT